MRSFSKEKYVCIGNHTKNHAILTNYIKHEIIEEISLAQNYLIQILGYKPKSFAYPNGNYSIDAFEALKFLNIPVAITTRPGKIKVEKINSQFFNLELNRTVIWGNKSILNQCILASSPFQLSNNLNKFFKKLL